MSKIKNKIESENSKGEKSLTVFLTAGFPNTEKFVYNTLKLIDAGIDILEIGLPFGDSLADGPTIQQSYIQAIEQKVNLNKTLEFISLLKQETNIPIVLMSSSNPILKYGRKKFKEDSIEAGIEGVIVPDVPLEEYDDFFNNYFDDIDTILLTTPTSSEERIKKIDNKSSGFLYCVSVVGTTGIRNKFDSYVLKNLERTYKTINNNKMQIGFGISNEEDVKKFSPYCDGVIVGSAVIKSIANDSTNLTNTINLIKRLKIACKF